MAKEIVYRKVIDLKKLPNNPRTIKKADMDRLKQSIKDNPDYFEARPLILSNRTGELVILAGNQRYEAAKSLGIGKVPTFLIEGLTPEREREIIIRDNVSNGEWDMDALANEWDTQELTDWGVDINWDEPEQEVVEDEAPEVNENEPADSVLGGVYQLGKHRLMCGDSTDAGSVAILMDGQKADMVFTDPPYNVDYEGGSKKREKIKNDSIGDFYSFLSSVYGQCWENMKDGASIYVCHSELERVNFTKAFLDIGFKLSSIIIWAKNNSTFSMNKNYKQKHEPILFGWKGTNHKWKGGNCEDTLWEIKRPSKSELHPTMKPIELCARAIKNSSDKNGLIYEPFGGSGSTLIACEQLGRKCYMMELDPKYCDVIRKRYWKFVTGSEEGWQDGTSKVAG